MFEIDDKRFYVYAHYKTGEENIPFYIGFGSGRRWNSREKRNKHWKSVVKKYGFYSKILANNLYKHEAKTLEIKLIGMFGRSDIGNGPLVNKTDGGDSSSGKLFENGHVPWNKNKTGIYSEQSLYDMGSGVRGKPSPCKGQKRAPFSQKSRKNISDGHLGINTWTKGRIWIHNPFTHERRTIISSTTIPIDWVFGMGPSTKEQNERNKLAQLESNKKRREAGIPHYNKGKKNCNGYIWIYNPKTFERTRIKPTENIPKGWIAKKGPNK